MRICPSRSSAWAVTSRGTRLFHFTDGRNRCCRGVRLMDAHFADGKILDVEEHISAPPARTLMPIHYLGIEAGKSETGAKREWKTHWFGQLKLMVPILRLFAGGFYRRSTRQLAIMSWRACLRSVKPAIDVADAERESFPVTILAKEAARGAAKRDGLAQQVG